MSMKILLVLAVVVRATLGCIPTVSPDDDDIMAQLEEMRTTMAMLESTATCGAECQPTTTLGTTVPTTTTEPTTTTTPTTTSTTTSTTTTSTTTTTTTTTCTAGTCMCMGTDQLFGNSCYRLIMMTYTYPQSATQCMMLGGTLCIITSPGENAFVQSLGGGASQFHIGGQRASLSDPYIWPDMVPFSSTWTNWASMQPSNLGLCTQFITASGEWRADNCDGTSFPCCEYPPMFTGK